MAPMNECIDSRAFAALILDYEYPGDDVFEPLASGRVLFDGCFHKGISARNREELIAKFRSGNY